MNDFENDNDQDMDRAGRLRSIAEKIQIGDAEEGAEALGSLLSEAAAGRRSIRDELADMAHQAETDAALNGFKKKYPKVAEDPILADAARSVLRDHVIEDLKAVGLTDEMIAPAGGDINRLGVVHNLARRRGLGVRKAGELLEATGETLSRKFNIPKVSRSHEEVIASMRQARGFRNDGSSGITNEDVRDRSESARTAAPAYPARPRQVQPATSEANRADRTRAYIEQRRAGWNRSRGTPSD